MLVDKRVEWVFRRVVSVFVRCVCAAWRSWGRVSTACVWRVWAVLCSDEMGGGETGDAMRHRWSAMVTNWSDRAEAMGAMFEWKKSMSLERISRLDAGTWPFSCAVTISVTA